MKHNCKEHLIEIFIDCSVCKVCFRPVKKKNYTPVKVRKPYGGKIHAPINV